jgi:hypothetical protein
MFLAFFANRRAENTAIIGQEIGSGTRVHLRQPECVGFYAPDPPPESANYSLYTRVVSTLLSEKATVSKAFCQRSQM